MLGMPNTVVKPPCKRRGCAGVEVFFVGLTRFAQVDVRVDQPGQFKQRSRSLEGETYPSAAVG